MNEIYSINISKSSICKLTLTVRRWIVSKLSNLWQTLTLYTSSPGLTMNTTKLKRPFGETIQFCTCKMILFVHNISHPHWRLEVWAQIGAFQIYLIIIIIQNITYIARKQLNRTKLNKNFKCQWAPLKLFIGWPVHCDRRTNECRRRRYGSNKLSKIC